MEFLVLMKLSEDGIGKTEEEKREIVEKKILPSIEMLMNMEREGMLSGGFFGGQRSAAFVMSVENEETLDDTIAELPCANIFEIEMVQLESLKEAQERDMEMVKVKASKAPERKTTK
jgi:hypothetical protein